MSRPHFLIVRVAALGDVAVASTLLARIHAERPDAHVTWVCGANAAPLVRLFSGVDEIVEVDTQDLYGGNPLRRVRAVGKVWMALLGRHFDRVFLVHADTRYRVLLVPLVTSPVTALSHDAARLHPARFRGDEYARLMDRASTGPIVRRHELADIRLKLPASPARFGESRRRVVLIPGGARNALRDDALRRWPTQRYRELASALLAQDHEVILLGDSDDAYVRPHFAGLNVVDHIGILSLVDALKVMRDADVVVASDTGPLHLARLVRTPVVALFGPTDPRQVVGEATDVRVLWGGAALPCRPCYDGRGYAACASNLCMQTITVDSVLRAIDETLLADQGAAEPVAS